MIDETSGLLTEMTRLDEPELVRLTGLITDTADPEQADRMADMLLLFLAAGGTVIGTMLGAILFLYVFASHPATFMWICALLTSIGLGGLGGCTAVLIVLHAKEMIIWEQRRNY